ncbi:MAG TPA: SHOCT domain-containing protein [Thermomicrobiales bacterium]
MGLIKTAGKAAVAASVVGRVQRRQQQRWAAQDQLAAGSAVPPAPGTAMDQRLAQLAKIGELRNAGVLTDAEFEAQKARILHA